MIPVICEGARRNRGLPTERGLSKNPDVLMGLQGTEKVSALPSIVCISATYQHTDVSPIVVQR